MKEPKLLSDFKEEGFEVTTSHGSVVRGFLADKHQDILFIMTSSTGIETRIVLSVAGVVAMNSILVEFAALGRITGKTSPE